MTTSGEEKEQPKVNHEETEEIPEAPVFMRDAPPTKKKMDMIKWGLMHDISEKDLEGQGFNPKTVRMAAYDLEKENYRKRPAKSRVQKEASSGGGAEDRVDKSVTTYGKRPLTIPTKPVPPEFLIDQISLPMDGIQAKNFEQGMKFGASMLVLGVRVAQELSNMGLQQARPIMDMANAMRQGEAEAAKGAAAEAAYLAAEQVSGNMLPMIASLQKDKAATGDPMKQMMVRTMEPMMQRVMNMVMPGFGGEAGNLPSGWTRKKGEE